MKRKYSLKKIVATILCSSLTLSTLTTTQVFADSVVTLNSAYSNQVCLGEYESAEIYFLKNGEKLYPYELYINNSVGVSEASPIERKEIRYKANTKGNYEINYTAHIWSYPDNYDMTGTLYLNVDDRVTSINTNVSDISIGVGEASYFNYTVLPSSAKTTSTISVSDTSVCSVVDGNKIVGHKLGTSVVTIKSKYGGLTKNIYVSVVIPPTSCDITQSQLDLTTSQQSQLSWKVFPVETLAKGVSFGSSNPTVATVNQSGLVTATGKGEATITMETLVGKKKDTCKINVTAVATGIDIRGNSQVLSAGDSTVLIVDPLPFDAGIKYKEFISDNPLVCKVDNSGKLTAISKGKANITCTAECVGGTFTDTTLVTVTQPVTGISILDGDTLDISEGSNHVLDVRMYPDNATPINLIYNSTKPSVATVDSVGRVTANSVGQTVIKVATSDGISEDEIVVNIRKAVTSLKLTEDELSLDIEGTYQLEPVVEPVDAFNREVKYTSSNTGVATVSTSGTIEPKGVGNSTITATSVDGNKSDSVVVKITKQVKDVNVVSPASDKINIDSTMQLVANTLPVDATNNKLIYTSSDTSTLSVDANGLVKSLKKGDASITITSDEGSISKVVNLKAWVPVTNITTDANKSVKVGESFRLLYNLEPTEVSNPSVVFTSNNDVVCSVDNNGTVVAKGKGTAKITVKSEDTGVEASMNVSVTLGVSSISIGGEESITLDNGQLRGLNCSVLPEEANNKNISWESSDSSVVSVDFNGLLITHKAGTAKITATSLDNTSLKDEVEVVVKQPLEFLNVKEDSIFMYRSENKKIEIIEEPLNHSDKIKFTPTNPMVISIDDETGEISAIEKGTSVIRVYSEEHPYIFDTVSVEVGIKLNGINTSIDRVEMGDTERKRVDITLDPEDADDSVLDVKVLDNSIASWDSVTKEVVGIKSGTTSLSITSLHLGITKSIPIIITTNARGVMFDKDIYYIMSNDADSKVSVEVTPPEAKDKSVVFSGYNSSILSLDSSGKVTPVAVGESDITVTTVDGSFKDTAKIVIVDKDLKFEDITEGLPVEPVTGLPMLTMNIGTVKEFKKIENTITRLSTESFISILDSNKISANAQGDTVLFIGYPNSEAGSYILVRVVGEKASLSVNKDIVYTGINKDSEIVATLSPTGHGPEDVTVEVLDTNIAKVINTTEGLTAVASLNGIVYKGVTADNISFSVRGIKNGDTKLRINNGKVAKEITVKVLDIPTTMTLNRTFNTCKVGEHFNLDVMFNVKFDEANVVWKSLDSSICSVDKTGEVYGLKEGTTKIEVYETISNLKEVCDVEIKKAIIIDSSPSGGGGGGGMTPKPVEVVPTPEVKPEVVENLNMNIVEIKTPVNIEEVTVIEKASVAVSEANISERLDKLSSYQVPMTRGELAVFLNDIYKFESKDNSYRTYTDINKDNEMYRAITNTTVFTGYPDGTFKPDKTITRAEMALICSYLPYGGKGEKEPESYKDIDSSEWFYSGVVETSNRGLFTGYEDGTFRPNIPVTKFETSVILKRIVNRMH